MTLRAIVTAAVYLALVPLVGRVGAWGTPLEASPFGAVEAPGLTENAVQAGAAVATSAASPLSIGSSRLEHRDVPAGQLVSVIREIARGADPVWVAYTVPTVPRSDTNNNWQRHADRVVLDEDGRLRPGNGTWGDTTTLAILALLKAGSVTNVATTDARVTIDAGRQHVVVLDDVQPREGVAWMASIVRDQAQADKGSSRSVERCAQGALAAIALTDDASADAELPRFTAADQPSWLRRDAAFWLGAMRGSAGAVVIDRLARTDPDADFRQHLTFVLTLTGPTGVDTLIELARHDTSTQVRGQALFWLGQKAGQRALGTLAGAVDHDPDSQVRRQAVFAISQLPKDEAIPKLIDLARTHRDPGVRQQAMFWLGQSGDGRALAFFEQVLSH
jgi:HEAT repeat protein